MGVDPLLVLGDQSGRTAIVTGGASGIGLATARGLAARGAHVVLAVRNLPAGETAARDLPGQVEARELDLAELDSIAAFAAAWTGPIDLLVNNAGVMMPPPSRTFDGFETQFGTNHLGHFALTNRLLGHVRDHGRVVTVSSNGHRFGNIDFDDLQWDRKLYHPARAYGQSKLANLLFTSELQCRLEGAGSTVIATAAHPGYVAASGLWRHSMTNPVLRLGNALGGRVIGHDADGGAAPTLLAALGDVPGGSFAGPGGLLQQRGAPKLVGRSRAARDATVAERLWVVSEELTGTHFSLER